MSLIDEYLKKAGGNWLKAAHVKPNDKLTIDRLWEDSESFDSIAICIEGIFSRDKEQWKARLGVQNVERVVEVLSTDETTWIGNSLRVLGTQTYPGIGHPGILWTAEKTTTQAPITAPPTTTIDITDAQTLEWLKANQELAGKEISADVFKALDITIKSELAMAGLVYRQEGKPWLHANAANV